LVNRYEGIGLLIVQSLILVGILKWLLIGFSFSRGVWNTVSIKRWKDYKMVNNESEIFQMKHRQKEYLAWKDNR